MSSFLVRTSKLQSPLGHAVGFAKSSVKSFARSQSLVRKMPVSTIPRVLHSTLTATKPTQTKVAVAEEIAEYSKYILNTYKRPPMIVEKGEGCYLYDSMGNKYLDFTAGIAVVALGHANPEVADILAAQAKKLVHVSNLFYTRESCQLAELLVKATLEKYPSGNKGIYEPSTTPKVFLTNSGTEANEGAIKFARKYGKYIAAKKANNTGKSFDSLDGIFKYNLHSFTGGFHGRSMGALSLTPNPKYQEPYTPLIPGATCSPLNDPKELDTFINDYTCGVILEPLQGEGGINRATPEFLKAVRARCDQVGAVLIYDEIQCGFGRTGKFWAHHDYPPECSPDIITFAKPLGNGFPSGGIMVSEKIAEVIGYGDHGTTFGGNPLGAVVGKYVVNTISDPKFLSNVTEVGSHLANGLNKISSPYLNKQILGTKGIGLIQGIQFKDSPSPIVELAKSKGLLLVEASNNTIRFVPPLIVTKDQVDTALGILEECLKEIFR
ncbi:hypothetical protein BB560_002332 [Smittium megazygosporum]|uniref:acetylornithine transaminase n=1 Tax=Smittium megazygosporum TaxID=133381 RepID=A0A2T9ZF25_9FUNG|nr:hypothetical protein BB560_002332 [Smittium megazygosporum]